MNLTINLALDYDHLPTEQISHTWSYEITNDSLIENVDGTERKIMLSDIQKHQFENGELKIQSGSAVITIPAGSTSRNQIERFSNSLSDCMTRS